VAAFHSTLEETREANLLLHVIDASQENYRDNIVQVNSVLKEIGAEDVPQIQVFNKVDKMEGQEPRIDRDDKGRVVRAWLSAQTGEGMALLQTALAEHFQANVVRQWLRIPAANGRLRAKLFTLGKVFQECMEENGDLLLDVRLDRRDLAALRKKEGVGDAVKDVNCCG
jgi:GTP-binding protein HflX